MNIPHLRAGLTGLRYSPFFVGLLFLLVTALGVRTSYLRQRFGIFVGDGGNKELRRASRANGLGVEHGVPLAILLVILEAQGEHKGTVVALGILIVAVRAAAAAGTTLSEKTLVTSATAGTYLAELLLSIWVMINGLKAF
jgi:uncharacterized membrane protein YecN with MAPEG domain